VKNHVLEQVRHLGAVLGELQGRVRAAVAGEVGRAVADAVREVVGTALLTGAGGPLVRPRPRYGGYADYPEDPWDDPEAGPPWARPEADEEPVAVTPDPSAVVAVAWTAGKWWLGRAGSPLGAAALGVAVAGAALAGGPAARAVLAVLWAAHRLLAATAALGDGAKALDRV
jgi:hypothetical protein